MQGVIFFVFVLYNAGMEKGLYYPLNQQPGSYTLQPTTRLDFFRGH